MCGLNWREDNRALDVYISLGIATTQDMENIVSKFKFYFCVSVHRSIGQIKHQRDATLQVLFLQTHSMCFGRQAPIIRSIKKSESAEIKPAQRCITLVFY